MGNTLLVKYETIRVDYKEYRLLHMASPSVK